MVISRILHNYEAVRYIITVIYNSHSSDIHSKLWSTKLGARRCDTCILCILIFTSCDNPVRQFPILHLSTHQKQTNKQPPKDKMTLTNKTTCSNKTTWQVRSIWLRVHPLSRFVMYPTCQCSRKISLKTQKRILKIKKHLWKPVNSSRRWEQKLQTSNWLWWTDALRTCTELLLRSAACVMHWAVEEAEHLDSEGRTEIQLNNGCQRPTSTHVYNQCCRYRGLDVLWQDTPKASERSQMPEDLSEAGNEHHIKEVEEPINSDDMVWQSPRENIPIKLDSILARDDRT